MHRAIRLISLAALAAIVVRATPAWAPFHLVVIDQVFHGSAECPNAQYVMLRTLSAGMVIVNNQKVTTQGADGTAGADFGAFDHNMPNGAAGVAMLIGTADAAALFGIAMDTVVTGSLPSPDGRLCFGSFAGDPVDCIAYGDFTGDNGDFGSPTAAAALGMALVRQSNTRNNANDFVLGTAAPRNNAGQTGTLGTCGGTAPTATPTPSATAPSSSPSATVPPNPFPCAGDCNGNGSVAINELILAVNVALGSAECTCPGLDCTAPVTINVLIRLVNNSLNGCPATPTVTETIIVEATTPPVSPTPTQPADGSLGTRRFSINPETSRFVAVLNPAFKFPTDGVAGYLDLRAGKPSGPTGAAFVDVVGASEYIWVDVPTGGVTVCLRVRQDRLPVERAGLLACNGGAGLGISVVLDHNLGTVGHCSGGDNDRLACSVDAECPGGNCFSAEDCTAARGQVEGPTDPHPGVCNGTLGGGLLPGDSGPGALMIAPDMATGVTAGLPIEILLERAPPCGDEDLTGDTVDFALTTSRATGEILHFNNETIPMMLTDEQTGANFDCANWTQEDGPGTLVVAGPTLDTMVNGEPADLISSFVLDD